jgi:exodeoxyribonuclease VII small subunit
MQKLLVRKKMADNNHLKSYSQLKQELEEIMLDLESNTDDIDKSIESYKKSMKIIDQMQKYLSDKKAEIKKLHPK